MQIQKDSSAAKSLSILNHLQVENSGDNIVISPLAIWQSLSLLANGCRGKTRSELLSWLSDKPGRSKRLNNESYLAGFNDVQEPGEHDFENSLNLAACGGIQFKAHFVQKAKQYFKAELAQLDPEDPAVIVLLNSLVCRSTKGKVASIIDRLDCCGKAELLVLSGVHFKGRWKQAFNTLLTQIEAFSLLDGSKVESALMHSKGSIKYRQDADSQAVCLPYGKSGRLELTVFLPRERGAEALSKLGSFLLEQSEDIFTGFSQENGSVFLPRMHLEHSACLVPSLASTGCTAVFSKQAELASMYRCQCGENPTLSLRQKAVFRLDEEGLENAETQSELEHESNGFSFRADRPFYFMVRDSQTSHVLIAGLLSNPAKACLFSK